MQAIEFALLNWVQTHLRCDFLDAVVPPFSALANHGELWIALAIFLLLFRRSRQTGLAVGCGLTMDLVACNLLLKPLVARLRPCDLNAAVTLLIPRPEDFSFPSGHTAASFAATAALRASGCWLWKPALALSVLMGLSRVYLYVHWPSDVVFGALLGWLCGYGGWKLVKFLTQKFHRHPAP